MAFTPNDISVSITGSQARKLHSEIPQGLSDFANPTVTDPKVAASFGVGLRSFLFEPETSFYSLQDRISDQLSIYAQGISIVSVDVNFDNINTNSISVSIRYLNPNKTIEQYLLSADLGSTMGSAGSATYV
jgi:hypothetical protein